MKYIILLTQKKVIGGELRAITAVKGSKYANKIKNAKKFESLKDAELFIKWCSKKRCYCDYVMTPYPETGALDNGPLSKIYPQEPVQSNTHQLSFQNLG